MRRLLALILLARVDGSDVLVPNAHAYTLELTYGILINVFAALETGNQLTSNTEVVCPAHTRDYTYYKASHAGTASLVILNITRWHPLAMESGQNLLQAIAASRPGNQAQLAAQPGIASLATCSVRTA